MGICKMPILNSRVVFYEITFGVGCLMGERLFAKIVVGLSVLLIISELVLIVLFGIRFELIFLPFVVFLASVGILIGLTFLKGVRPEIESVSSRRARAMKDEKVRKLLDGYEVDEEFLPGRWKKKKQRQQKQQVREAGHAGPFSRPVMPEDQGDPFADLDPKLHKIAKGFGGFEQMIYKVEAMDTVAFKRLQYTLDMQGVDKNQLLQPVREALSKAARGCSGLRKSLDHEEMEEYMEQVTTGRKAGGNGAEKTYSLDIDMNDIAGRVPPPPDEFSHKPRDVIDRFKKSLNRK